MSYSVKCDLKKIVRQVNDAKIFDENATKADYQTFFEPFVHEELEDNLIFEDLEHEMDEAVSFLKAELKDLPLEVFSDIELRRILGQEIAWRREQAVKKYPFGTDLEKIRQDFVQEAIAGPDPLTDKTSVAHQMGEMQKYFRSWADFPAFGFGVPMLDDATGGILPGEICVLTGAPGTMKTSLALGAVDDFVTRTSSGLVYYCSVDMAPREIVTRLMERECLVRESSIRWLSTSENDRDRAEYAKYKKTLTDKYTGRLAIKGHTPTERMNITSLLHECLKRQPQLVIIDYFTRLKSATQSDLEFVEQAMPLIIEHAHRYETSFLILSQMSRSSRAEQATGRMGGHGKGGGIVEELAHTEIELTQQPSEQQGEKPLVIAAVTKARRGIAGQFFSLDYNGPFKKFTGVATKMRKKASSTRTVFESQSQNTGFYA